MPAIEVWGPAVWTLFHTMAERVHEEAYPYIAKQLFGQIVNICKVLPCPDCATDASNFLAKIDVSTLKTKTEFKNLMYLFHNYVNVKKRNKLFNVIHLDMYNNYKLIPVVNNFLVKFNTKGNLNLINESFQRNLVKNNFKKWFSENLRAFTKPPSIQQSLEEKVPTTLEEVATTLEEEVSVPLEEEDSTFLEENLMSFDEVYTFLPLEEEEPIINPIIE